MFENKIDIPLAIAPGTSKETINLGIQWAEEQVKAGDELTWWFPTQKSRRGDLTPNARTFGARECVSNDGSIADVCGPVVAFYADPRHMSRLMDISGMTALSVLYWSDPLETWSRLCGAHRLAPHLAPDHDPSSQEEYELTLSMTQKLEKISRGLNQDNPIDSGFEKRDLLLGLREMKADYGYLPANQIAQWAIAQGWKRDNPMRLLKMIKDLNAGKNLRLPRY